MAKQSRKRSSGSKQVKKPLTVAEKLKKLAAYKPPAYNELDKLFPVRCMMNSDVAMAKDIFAMSNTLAGLKKKYADTALQVRFSKKFVKQLKEGEIKGPLMLRVSPTLFVPMQDMKKAIKSIESECEMLEETNKLSKGQLQHRYEDYVDTLIRFERHLKKLIGNLKISTISGHRPGKDVETAKEEEIIYEKVLNDEMKKEDLMQVKKDMKKAIETNKAKKAVKK